MLSFILPLPVGNALRIFFDVPAGAVRWRLLRRVTDAFSGPFDTGAVLVSESTGEASSLDFNGLKNSTLYFYRLYSLVGDAWQASASMSSTPAAVLEDAFSDVLEIVRDRLDVGLQTEVAAGVLIHKNHHIQVLTAPPVFETTLWPVVSVHLQSDSANTRSIGDEFGDFLDGDEIATDDGWLASVQLTIMGWSLNPDGRIELRKALRRVIQGNLPIFDDAGMMQIEVSFSDSEDFTTYGAPVYQVVCTMSCLAPSAVRSRTTSIINEIISTNTTP